MPAHHLAQSVDRLARLQPAGARHAGGITFYRSFCAGAQHREPRCARTLPCENLMERASDILRIISARKAAGEPFALATVVRTVAATAAKAGAKAVILPDGTISEGWIGGGCARAAVLKAAKDALADGKSRLVSVQPSDLLDQQGHAPGEEQGGVRFAKNMCPSQGTMDIFVEPGARYIVVSTQGRGDEAALLAALAVDADYIAYVGSRKKADSLKASLVKRGISDERLAKLKAPAGLDLGAITPEEIAISILAEIVAVQRRKDSRGEPRAE